MYSLTVLEARGPKSRCWQGRALSEGSSAVVLLSRDAALQSLPFRHMPVFLLCVSLLKFSSSYDASH